MYRNYLLFHTGSDGNKFHGVGLLINKNLRPNFERISDRICSAQIKIGKRMPIVISAYAPTLQISEQNPVLREEFYEQLDSVISKVRSRNIVLMVGLSMQKQVLVGENLTRTLVNIAKAT